MRQWEYLRAEVPHITETDTHSRFFGRTYTTTRQRWSHELDQDYMSWLNKLGEQGWEVVKLEYSYGLFKRQKAGGYREP
jgi:hypothetical protein